MRPGALALAGWLMAGAASAAPGRVAVLLEARGPEPAAVIDQIRRAVGGDVEIAVRRMPPGDAINPIQRGRLLAGLATADLVVAIADRPAEFVLQEREETPVFCVGAASLVAGRFLTAPDVGGILPYDVEGSLALLHQLGLAPVGLAYTPGYRAVAERVEGAARARGIRVVSRVVGTRRSLGPAVRELTRDARVVWVLGDPLLTRGAGFSFLVEQSLAADVPIVAPARFEVERGALLAFEPEWAVLAASAAEGLRELFAGGAPAHADRFQPASGAGTFLLNRALAGRWNISVPREMRWRSVP